MFLFVLFPDFKDYPFAVLAILTGEGGPAVSVSSVEQLKLRGSAHRKLFEKSTTTQRVLTIFHEKRTWTILAWLHHGKEIMSK